MISSDDPRILIVAKSMRRQIEGTNDWDACKAKGAWLADAEAVLNDLLSGTTQPSDNLLSSEKPVSSGSSPSPALCWRMALCKMVDTERINQLLSAGWEPFACGERSGGPVILFKKFGVQ